MMLTLPLFLIWSKMAGTLIGGWKRGPSRFRKGSHVKFHTRARVPTRRIILFLLTLLLLIASHEAKAGQSVTTSPLAHHYVSSGMTRGQAAVLGMVEGLTEYLPVSSTGHLLLAQHVMGIGGTEGNRTPEAQRSKQAADAYAICIQAGAILAVLGLYLRRVRQMIVGIMGKDRAGLNMVCDIAAGFMPAAVIGLLFESLIKRYLFGLRPVVAAWFVGGVAILAVAWWRKRRPEKEQRDKSLEQLTWKMALIIGFAQCIAMWPGVSRSLITIVAGLLVGLSLPAAVEFSFLLGMVTLGAATGYDALRHGQIMLQMYDFLAMATGFVVAFIAAVLSVKWMVSYLNRHGLSLFGYYRVGIAAVVATLMVMGVL
jgi:undecaprenyl-diphosphatase